MVRKIEKQYFYIHECETRINIQKSDLSFEIRKLHNFNKLQNFNFSTSHYSTLYKIIRKRLRNLPRYLKKNRTEINIVRTKIAIRTIEDRRRRTRETKRKNERTNGNAKFRKIEEVDSGARDPREEGNFETEPPPPPPPYVRTRGLSHCSRIMAPLYTRVVPIMSRTGDAWNAYEEKRPCLREQHRHPALPALPPSQTWERGSRRYPPPPAAVVHLQTRPESRWAGTCVIGRPRRESFLVPWLELNRAWKKIRWEKSRGSFPCVFVYFRVWRNGDGWTCTYSRLSRDRARKKGNN